MYLNTKYIETFGVINCFEGNNVFYGSATLVLTVLRLSWTFNGDNNVFFTEWFVVLPVGAVTPDAE